MRLIQKMQDGSNPPHLVPFTEIHRAVYEETLAALRRLIKQKRLIYFRQLNDHSVSIDKNYGKQ